MIEHRPDIPLPMKRIVRQRCGFGCVICGQPFYEYDHIINYSIVKEHTQDNLTLLCKKHHGEKTDLLLSLEQVRLANQNPYNINNKESSPYLFNFHGANFSVIMGDIHMTLNNVNSDRDYLIPFLINNKKLISFEILDNQLFLNLVLIDENGNMLLKIVENEMVYSSEQWDIERVGRNLKIRTGRGNVIFDIDFLIPNSIQINKAQFNADGYQIDVQNGGFFTKGFQIFMKNIVGFRVVCALGEYDQKTPVMLRG